MSGYRNDKTLEFMTEYSMLERVVSPQFKPTI